MNHKWTIAALTSWCVIVACCGAKAGEPLIVNAMTFNIRMNTVSDGPNRWPQRCEMAVELVRRFGGDFVGIQEALPDQMADLAAMLPEYHSLGRSREANRRRGEATPILYRHKRWQLDPEQQGTFWLSDTPQTPGSITWGNACPRIVTWGRFVDNDTQRGVYVYNTHFDHKSEPSRQKSAALLAKHISERTRHEPVIVTGDFNSGESDGAMACLTGKTSGSPIKLVDTFRALHPNEKQVGTAHGFLGKASTKIDYVLVLPGAKVLSAEILRDNRDGRYPSDHFPVTGKVAYPVKDSNP